MKRGLGKLSASEDISSRGGGTCQQPTGAQDISAPRRVACLRGFAEVVMCG